MIAQLISTAFDRHARAAQLEGRLAAQAPGLEGPELRALADELEGYLAAVPDGLQALTAMTKTAPYGRSVAFAAGQVLIYLLDDDDLLPDDEFGPLGLLDDAYLVHGCLAALRATLPGLEVPDGYEPPSPKARDAVRTLLPAGAADALDRTCASLVAVAASLYVGGGGTGPATEAPTPQLRIDEAVGLLRR